MIHIIVMFDGCGRRDVSECVVEGEVCLPHFRFGMDLSKSYTWLSAFLWKWSECTVYFREKDIVKMIFLALMGGFCNQIQVWWGPTRSGLKYNASEHCVRKSPVYHHANCGHPLYHATPDGQHTDSHG